MNSSDYLPLFKNHPNHVIVIYNNYTVDGIFDTIITEIFNNGIQRIYDNKLSVITEYFTDINKKTNPTITVDNTNYKIIDHYKENKFITTLVLQ